MTARPNGRGMPPICHASEIGLEGIVSPRPTPAPDLPPSDAAWCRSVKRRTGKECHCGRFQHDAANTVYRLTGASP
jgi:hypothetical protein